MTPNPEPTTLTFEDTLAFYQALDRLVVRRLPVVIVVPVPPERDAALYTRIRRCQTPEAVEGVFRQAPSSLSKPGFMIRLFHWVYRKPNYFAYEAVVRKDLDPLEVHLRPLN